MKMTKAKHVGQGLTQDRMSIFTGFEKGITRLWNLLMVRQRSKGGVRSFSKELFRDWVG